MPLDKWAPLRKQLDGWQFTNNFAVNVGDETGPLFSYSHGNLTVHTPVLTFSTSKWPMAMMVLGLVADGTIASLDDRVNKYLKWWSNSTDELKSRITVRQLLSFTSGFGGGSAGSEELTNTCMDNTSLPLAHDYMACAQHLYETTNLTGLPGLAFSYNSFHLQFAGAVAVAASGLNIQQVLNKYFYAPYQMNETNCVLPSAQNPQLAVCLNTTASDYEKFLGATLTRSVLPAHLVAESERDYTPFLGVLPTLYGTYGFGHWLECYDSVVGVTAECKADQIHCDPGALGFYPLIDRKRQIYMQIVANESGTPALFARSGIPEYLRFLVKPLVDAIIDGDALNSLTFAHHTPKFNGLTLADINYMTDCLLHPEDCQ